MNRRIKIFLLMTLILLGSLSVLADSAFALAGLARPSMFLVNHDRIYVLDRATVYVYSLKEHKLINKFGKAGEGPTEFIYSENNGRPLSMCIYNGQVIVNSSHRRTYFDLDGNFIKVERVPVDRLLFPVDGKILGIGLLPGKDRQQYVGYTLHDKEFKSEKTIFLSDVEMNNPRKLILPLTSFTYNPAYKENFYISVSSDDFKINVYDIDGKKSYVIAKDYPKIKIPANFKHDSLAYFKNHRRFKRSFELIKKILHIRDYFPPIRDLQIVDDFIYVLTFKRQGEKWELIKMDLRGNEKGRTFVALNTYEPFSFYPILYSVCKGKIYTLVEDEEEETWKVHMFEF